MFTSRRRREALVLGSELLVNGDFNAGATGWTVSNADATHIATFDGSTLRYQSDTISPQLIVAQNGVLTIGRMYQITAVISARVSGSVNIQAGTTAQFAASAVGTFTTRLICGGGTNLSITRNGTNVDITIDSVSVRQVGP